MVIGLRKREVRIVHRASSFGCFAPMAAVHVQRGRDVDHAQFFDTRSMVQRQPMRHTPAPVVPTQKEIGHPQGIQQAHDLLGHGALAVVQVLGISHGMR